MKYQSEFIKYPYSALSINNPDYDSFLLFKNWCSTSFKSGYIRKGELQSIAVQSGININKLYRLLSVFKKLHWVLKEGNGYRLVSTNHINNNLSLKPKTNKSEGFVYYPFFKVHKNNMQHLDAIKIDALINQQYDRSLYLRNKANKEAQMFFKQLPKGKFKIALSTLKDRGNYKFNSEVDKHIDKAVKLGLLDRKKNGFNNSMNKFNPNEYTLSYYRWYEILSEETIVKVKRIKKEKIQLNPSEIKFKEFVEKYIQKPDDRQIARTSYNKILNGLLNNDRIYKFKDTGMMLRNKLFECLNVNDILIEKRYVDRNRFTNHKVDYLPKYIDGKFEYGIEYKFRLCKSGTTSKEFETVLLQQLRGRIQKDFYVNEADAFSSNPNVDIELTRPQPIDEINYSFPDLTPLYLFE